MQAIEHIIESFGGVTALARALGKPVTTVQYWKESGRIPDKEKARIIEISPEHGLNITFDSFFMVK